MQCLVGQRVFGDLLHRDVLGRAKQAFRSAVGAQLDAAQGADPPHGLVGEQKTMFEKEWGGSLDTARRADSRSSGWVRSMSAAVVGSSLGPKPNTRESSRDQLTLFVAYVELPASDLGDALDLGQ